MSGTTLDVKQHTRGEGQLMWRGSTVLQYGGWGTMLPEQGAGQRVRHWAGHWGAHIETGFEAEAGSAWEILQEFQCFPWLEPSPTFWSLRLPSLQTSEAPPWARIREHRGRSGGRLSSSHHRTLFLGAMSLPSESSPHSLQPGVFKPADLLKAPQQLPSAPRGQAQAL